MRTLKVFAIATCALVVNALPSFPTQAHGLHPGGLDARGCHAGSRPYHCHRAQSEMVRTADGRNRIRCDLGSRSQECRSQRGSYASSGVAASYSVDVQTYQRALMRHCSGLPNTFADGYDGPATREALMRFQRAYGLIADGIYGPTTQEALNGEVTGMCFILQPKK